MQFKVNFKYLKRRLVILIPFHLKPNYFASVNYFLTNSFTINAVCSFNPFEFARVNFVNLLFHIYFSFLALLTIVIKLVSIECSFKLICFSSNQFIVLILINYY